jgi:peptidylprolyl isomerase/FKBP-type peptidyl-prolyl cis-trans isomerase FklB
MNRRLVLCALAALSLAACGKSKDAAPVAPDANLAAGRAFLATNAKAPGVVTLPDGLQYKVVKSGPTTVPSPRPQDLVKVHYEGKLLDGTVFDSSYERGQPAVFPLKGLVPAWVTALQLMHPGDEWTLWVPSELGYGAEDKGAVPPNSVMVFRIELIDVARQGA